MTEKKLQVDDLKGFTLDDVRMPHSDKPAQLSPKVYSQGEGCISAGREKHLPHDPRHVVTPKAGLVGASGEPRGLPEKNLAGLEHEADRVCEIWTDKE